LVYLQSINLPTQDNAIGKNPLRRVPPLQAGNFFTNDTCHPPLLAAHWKFNPMSVYKVLIEHYLVISRFKGGHCAVSQPTSQPTYHKNRWFFAVSLPMLILMLQMRRNTNPAVKNVRQSWYKAGPRSRSVVEDVAY